jgi:hypothetical protein
MWKEFRSACDAVFGQRDAVRTEQREAVESQLAQAEQLCRDFQAALESTTSETAHSGVLSEFNARFDALRELPRDAARRVEQRFRETERNYRMLLRQAQHDAVMRGVDALYDIDEALAKLEQTLAGSAALDDVAAQLRAIDALDPERPGPFAERVKALVHGDAQALRNAGASTNPQRRRLAIEMEIAAGLDTPANFQQDRLALQVDRLNQGMKHRRVMEEAPMQIAERWCKTGPVLDDDGALRERFFRACRSALE